MSLAIVLLAAGQGTRMNSKKQKILHEVGGKPMFLHLFEAAEQVSDEPPVLVVGPGEPGVRDLVGDRARYVTQAEQLGTGHATLMAKLLLAGGPAAQVLVTYGDMPLLTAATMRRLAKLQAESGAAIAMLTFQGDPRSSFGRIVRATDGSVREIVEVAEARRRPDGEELLAIREQNAGVYCFEAAFLWAHIDKLPLRQARRGPEYYLTDMVETAVSRNRTVQAIVTTDADECLGAGTRQELVAVEKAFRRRANTRWLAQGVTLVDPETIFIDPDVEIGRDTVIWPHSYLQGRTVVGEECVIGPGTLLRDAAIGDRCRLEQVHIEGTTVTAGTRLRPFSVLRREEQPVPDSEM